MFIRLRYGRAHAGRKGALVYKTDAVCIKEQDERALARPGIGFIPHQHIPGWLRGERGFSPGAPTPLSWFLAFTFGEGGLRAAGYLPDPLPLRPPTKPCQPTHAVAIRAPEADRKIARLFLPFSAFQIRRDSAKVT